jgi:hypothetical protein
LPRRALNTFELTPVATAFMSRATATALLRSEISITLGKAAAVACTDFGTTPAVPVTVVPTRFRLQLRNISCSRCFLCSWRISVPRTT